MNDHSVEYEVDGTYQYCIVDGLPLEEFLQKRENISKHEFIRQNILTATINFDNRYSLQEKSLIEGYLN